MHARQTTDTTKEKRLFSIDELAEYLSIGKTRAAHFGKDAGAQRNIGRRVLYDRKLIDKAIDAIERR